MNASERFARLLAGKSIDRLPVIEWAPWWDLTVKEWRREGLPEECAGYEELQRYFSLDRCLQTSVSPRTDATPEPAGFGSGIMATEDDYYDRVRPTLYPDPARLLTDEKYAALVREGGDALHFFTVPGFFWFPRELFGIEAHLYSFYDEPELLKAICDDYADWLERVFAAVFARFRFDFMSFAEDMSYNNGPMIGKAQFDEFLAPFYRRVIPLIHSYGVPVFIDSDGDITRAVDWYASVGADGMFPLEKQAGTDVSVYIDKQPALAYLGHFDKMCMHRGEEAMRAEFERLLPSVLRGKVIPSVDHQTPPDVTMENYRIYVRLLKEYAGRVTHADRPLDPCPVYEYDGSGL